MRCEPESGPDSVTDQKADVSLTLIKVIDINRTCPVLLHPPLSATTTKTTTAPATTSSVTSTYCMEEPPTSLTPHTNESPRHHKNERPPSGNSRRPRRPRDISQRPRKNPRPGNALEVDSAGGPATPSTPRSTSPDRTNDPSTPQPRWEKEPKPKSVGTPGVQDPGHKPANENPPSKEPSSRQRRNQGKPGGGTDSRDSKPPRRGNETIPDRKESAIDSEPIHGSADANPSLLKQGHPRQKRRGKFDGKLTTGDVEPRQEERRVNPNREKYRVDYAAEDLTSSLIHDLRTPPYLDCVICFNAIRPHEPTWSCSPSTPVTPTEDSQQVQCCWATFHLKCVRSWASKSIADLRQAYKARGEDKPGQWLCPGCRAKRVIEPSLYRYELP